MKLAVITDSGSNLSLEYIKSIPNLRLVPLQINVNGTYYRDILEIKPEDVYENLKTKHITTSLPQTDDYLKTIEDLKNLGYTDILVISISSGLSGTYNAFRNANELVEGINIHMYDTKTLSLGQGYIVKEAIKLIEEKKALKDIIKQLDDLRHNKLLAMFTVETLKWLRKGGRIGFVEGTIGDILHVKPVIEVNDDGVYHTTSKGFGLKRTYITMRKKTKDFIGNSDSEVTVLYGDNLEEAEEISKKMVAELNVDKIDLVPITPVLGVHTGPGILAIVARKK